MNPKTGYQISLLILLFDFMCYVAMMVLGNYGYSLIMVSVMFLLLMTTKDDYIKYKKLIKSESKIIMQTTDEHLRESRG